MDICLWDKCNNHCLMCTNPERSWPAWDGSFKYDYKSLIKRIKKAEKKIKTYDSIYLTGGEPTLHPRFPDILKYISNHFPEQKIKLLTNGRIFSYQDFAKKILEITDNLDIELSLYGPNSKIHEAVTRTPDSFNQTIKGLENLLTYKKQGQLVNVRFVITGISYKYLTEFLKLLKGRLFSIDRVMLIFWEIENQAVKNIKTIEVTYGQVRPYLEKVSSLLRDFKDIRLYHFPLCTLPEKFWPYLWRTLPKNEVIFNIFCKQCQYQKYCLGIPKKYFKIMGAKEFNPIKKNLVIKETDNVYQPIKKVIKK